MKKLLALSLVLFLSACGLFPQAQSDSGEAGRQRVALAQNTNVPGTSTPIPTSTLNHQATLDAVQSTLEVAQAEADAAKRLMVDATMTHEAFLLIQIRLTESSDIMTRQASAETLTARPSAVPLTETKAAYLESVSLTKNADSRTQLAATLAAPTQLLAMERARVEAKFAEASRKVDIGVMVAIGFFCVSMSLFLLACLFYYPEKKAEESNVIFIQPLDELDQPQRPRFKSEIGKNGEFTMHPVEIDCSNDQLLEFADGVVNRQMTTSFNLWEKTDVHKNLKKIRLFLEQRKYAKLVRGSNGMLDLTAEGEHFLRETLRLGGPPPPYICMPQNSQ